MSEYPLYHEMRWNVEILRHEIPLWAMMLKHSHDCVCRAHDTITALACAA